MNTKFYKFLLFCALFANSVGQATVLTCSRETFGALTERVPTQGDYDRELSEGAKVFKAIDDLMAGGVTNLPNGGRALSIPDAHRQELIKQFIRAYVDPARNNPKDPIAGGNLGHMNDHLQLYRKYAGELEKLGIDSKSLLLAIVAHDTGKATLDADLAAYIKSKSAGAPGPMPFLYQRVGAHEYHSIANVVSNVQTALKKAGVDVDSPEGRNLVTQYSAEIIESIRLHNGVGVRGSLEAQYTSLKPEEIEQVRTAWWANFARGFANQTDSQLKDYGETAEAPVSPIGQVLNLFDRITLTAPAAPWKLGGQNANSMPLSPFWVKASFIDSANGNDALVLAQGEKVVRALSVDPKAFDALPKEEKRRRVETNPMVQEGLTLNRNLRSLGETVLGMNDPAALARRFNVPENELPLPPDVKAKGPTVPRQYLYWTSSEPGQKSYRVIAESDAAVPARLEVWNGSGWQNVVPRPQSTERSRQPGEIVEADFRSATHLLMAVARNAGAWKATPP